MLLCLLDTIDFPAAFLGAIKAGIVPIAANTMLTTRDYDYMLHDSRARALVVSAPLLPTIAPVLADAPAPAPRDRVRSPGADESGATHSLAALMAAASTSFEPAETTRDDACFWLYSSGSTGAPKGTVHVHSSLILTAELYARPVLGLREDDVVFSGAKLFFAYGLGNALTFPMAVGATAVLMAERSAPAALIARLARHRPTIFYGVPTLLCGAPREPGACRSATQLALRLCASAGEALPAEIGSRWTERFGVEILDGLGSTEMLHIFLSNRPGQGPLRDQRAFRCPATSCESSATTANRSPADRSASCRSTGRRRRSGTGTIAKRRAARSRGPGRVAATSTRSTPDGYYLYVGSKRRHAEGGRRLRFADRGRVGAGERIRRCWRRR